MLLRKLKKDAEVLLLPLGGSSLIRADVELELEELHRITDNVSAIVDSEKDSADAGLPQERAGFARACEAAGIPCLVLERRATENYLSDRAVKEVKGSEYRALQPYERLSDVAPSWSKRESWRIAQDMDLSELEGTDLISWLRAL